MKICYFDVETTGLDPAKHGIIQLSGAIEIDGEIKEEFNYRVQPPKGTVVDHKALEINGVTIDQIRTFEPVTEVWKKFGTMLLKYINPSDYGDRFFPAGYNVMFDYQFLRAMVESAGSQWFYYFNYKLLDVYQLVHVLVYAGELKLCDSKLKTVCDHYGIEIKAHDAMSDIKATRQLFLTITNKLTKGN